MLTHAELRTALNRTFDDGKFSKAEKEAIRALATDMDEDTRRFARRIAFEIAHVNVAAWPAPQVLEWLEALLKALDTPRRDSVPPVGARVFFSPGNDCRDAVEGFIKRARETLDICVFTITDNRIEEALRDQHRHGVKIRIVSDRDKAEDRGSDIHKLARAGLDVRIDTSDAHMHHKFAIADGHSLLNGSYNWTRSAFMENDENVVICEEPGLIRAFEKEFESLYSKAMAL